MVAYVSEQQTLEPPDQLMSSVLTSTWYLTAPGTGVQLNWGSYIAHCALTPAEASIALETESPVTVDGHTQVKAEPVAPGEVPTGLLRASFAVTVQ